MFICRNCIANKHQFDVALTRSVGPCEVCRGNRMCADIPSMSLPPMRRTRTTADGTQGMKRGLV